ncbi:MAG: biotin/lipoyl-binding protein, partial [Deltaproteobacteria bacterium]
MKNSSEQSSANKIPDKIEDKVKNKTGSANSKRYLILFAIILFVGLAVHRTKQNEIKKNLIYVEVTHPLYKEMIDAISTTGSLIAEKQIMLSSKIPGKIQSVSVEQGDTLQKGQKLIQLEATELELQKSIAESAQRSAASVVDEENYKRHKILYEEGVITKAEFDKIESEYKAATAEKERLEKTVELQSEQASSSIISAPF